MVQPRQGKTYREVKRIYRLANKGKLEKAVRLTLQVENNCKMITDSFDRLVCQKYIAACLVDIGGIVKNEEMVRRGTEYFLEWTKHTGRNELSDAYYNLANGYFGTWLFNSAKYIEDGVDADEHRLSRRYYRQSINQFQLADLRDTLATQVWTNYDNSLSHVGRSIEAIDAYDRALRIDSKMGMALGNKGIAISFLAPMMHGHRHLFYLEAMRLLKAAISQPLAPEARSEFNTRLLHIEEVVQQHGTMLPEEIVGIQPVTDFHVFLCEFCAKHSLFLNPATLLGEDKKAFYGDPMFIATMYADINDESKFDRYVTFLNEIKQEYVLGRYFLAQSQYQTPNIDAVDEGVSLYHPLDYSLYSTYIQLLKAANKQAFAVLDKIAYFIYDYCKLKTPPSNRVSFRQIWGGGGKLRDELNAFGNPHLFALFNLSRDISKNGDWEHIYDYRNASTHRFLVVHDMQLADQSNKDIPRVYEGKLISDTILALKIARAALVYLILSVEHQEKTMGSERRGRTIPIVGTPVEGVLRHRPLQGDE